MKVIVMSDTHDNKYFFERLRDWVGLNGVDIAIHAGDHVAPFTVEWAEKAGIKMMYGVLGNNDGEYRLLHVRYQERGWSLSDYLNVFELEGVKIALTHGTDMDMPFLLAESGRYDIVIFGHTHRMYEDYIGKTLLLNPGEACGYLTGHMSFMVLDLKNRRVDKIMF